MKIPEKMSLEEFEEVVENFKANCHEREGVLCHDDCDTKIRYAICNISIHDGLSCGGTGEVTTRRIPYCPECEEMFETLFACVHKKPLPFPQHKNIPYIFALLAKLNVFSLFIGGGIGALITYLILHR